MVAHALLFIALSQTPPLQATNEPKLVGMWKAESSSFKFVISEKAKADLKAAGQNADTELAKVLPEIKKATETLKLSFKEDHAFLVTTKESPDGQKGKWSLKELVITVKMQEEAGTIPKLVFSKDYKKITLTFDIPEFGVGSLELTKLPPATKNKLG